MENRALLKQFQLPDANIAVLMFWLACASESAFEQLMGIQVTSNQTPEFVTQPSCPRADGKETFDELERYGKSTRRVGHNNFIQNDSNCSIVNAVAEVAL